MQQPDQAGQIGVPAVVAQHTPSMKWISAFGLASVGAADELDQVHQQPATNLQGRACVVDDLAAQGADSASVSVGHAPVELGEQVFPCGARNRPGGGNPSTIHGCPAWVSATISPSRAATVLASPRMSSRVSRPGVGFTIRGMGIARIDVCQRSGRGRARAG